MLNLDYLWKNISWQSSFYKHKLFLIYQPCVVILYIASALSNQDIVRKYLPSIAYQAQIRGYTRKITDIACGLGSLLSVISFINYYYLATTNSNGFKIFAALSGYISTNQVSLRISELNLLRKKGKKHFKLYTTAQHLTNLGFVTGSLTTIIHITINDKLASPLWFAILANLIFVTFCYFIARYLWTPIAHLHIITNYFIIRIQHLNKIISVTKRFNVTPRLCARMISEHNSVAADIAKYSRFWRFYYFFAVLLMLPYNLFVLHALLFGDIPAFTFFGYFPPFVFSALYIFLIGYFFASIS